MTITPEMVMAARAMAKVGACDATEQHTLVELCRQQHEALKTMSATTPYWNVHNVSTLNRIDTLLALWPDDPTEEKP